MVQRHQTFTKCAEEHLIFQSLEEFVLKKSNIVITVCLFISLFFSTHHNVNASLPCVVPVFINEFHYDNAGGDVGEFIEVAGPAGTDLTGWILVLYNGSGGASYNTINLSGTMPNEGASGFGTLSFSAAGMQNGAPDGIALVDNLSAVQEFLSYEGAFTATDGPANGMTSTDVGVAETSSTPIGESLQRIGTGECPGDFTWIGPTTESPGSTNTGQTFTAADTPPSVASTNPADLATEADPTTDLTINFNEDVTFTGGVTITCTDGGPYTAGTPTGGPATWTVTITPDLAGNTTCTVTIPSANVTDLDGTPDNMASDYMFSFSTAYANGTGASTDISDEEPTDQSIVSNQDTAWRTSAAGACSSGFETATLTTSDGMNGPLTLTTTYGNGQQVDYSKRDMDGPQMGTENGIPNGSGCAGGTTLQDGSPRPLGIPGTGCYYNDGGVASDTQSPNGVLFTFTPPIEAYGAWFGDLETKANGTGYYNSGADGGTGEGGTNAIMRLFFEDGTMQEIPIDATHAPAGAWLAASAPPTAFPVSGTGDISFCGGSNDATDADGCGNETTRWLGFVASSATNLVTHMVVAVGDDDHSGSGPSDGPNVACTGGTANTCNGGTEFLSFVGPTTCADPPTAVSLQEVDVKPIPTWLILIGTVFILVVLTVYAAKRHND